mgnify:CR=1 FL=1|jgi:MoxR-like ATPase
MQDSNISANEAINTIKTLRTALTKVIRGRDDTLKLVLTGMIADGHVLIEDYPGSGKTTLAKTLGRSIDCALSDSANKGIVPFRRVQFTPDLLPSDVLGVNVFEPNSGTFTFQHGPIFAHIVLADEINRTGPKVQAAFLECMAERQVTIDNVTYPLDDLFFVIGTQNPLDVAGTYPLPLVQLDRFLLRVPMRYVDEVTELEILNDVDEISKAVETVKPVVTREEIIRARHAASAVHIAEPVLKAIVGIVQATRTSSMLQFGASTRAAIMLKKALGAWALCEGRDYVTEDDLKTLAPMVLAHRLKFHPGAGDPIEAFSEFLRPHLEALISQGLKAAG